MLLPGDTVDIFQPIRRQGAIVALSDLYYSLPL